MVSCGPLLKLQGVVKTPPAANYLDGDRVQFSCKPKYYIHGDIERVCRNGTWSKGAWAWCRDRDLEYALKWMTALLSIFGIVMIFVIIFCCLWSARKRRQRDFFEGEGVVEEKKEVKRASRTTPSSLPEKEPLRDSPNLIDDQPAYMRGERRVPSYYEVLRLYDY